ncbi:RIP metalloprotease RseP [Fodinicurvata fenggangensis]|uniref:RIP metalloprotease RseP n=1 Tax=Fodinicurvata fenggangensis TaxID=1121830 RepID=UPI00047ED56F|nr:RIP metalloprotease RseP [Fodinicurvata fenggangensis]
MQFLSGIGDFVIPFLIILTVLVFVHELGHYLVARWCGVRIDAFSIGFGPELFGWNDRHGTRWKFSAIPLGGYVKMFGDADVTSRPAPSRSAASSAQQDDHQGQGVGAGEETGSWAGGRERPLTPEEKAVSFHHKSLAQRVWIVSAGPVANFLFALVVLAGFFFTFGQPTTPPVIGQVLPESAAAESGLQSGDRIVAINGSEVERFEQIQRAVQLNLSAPLDMEVVRDSRNLTLTVTPEIVEAEDGFGNVQEVARLGITASGTEFVRYGLLQSTWMAGEETVSLVGATMKALGQIITGSRSTDELGGPVRIAEMSGYVADTGMVSVLWFMAVLSINLGLINLFPVPMLDGGHLLFYAFEAVRGRPLGERAQEIGFRIGLGLVLTLFVFVTWNDLVRLRVFDFLAGS